MNQSLNILLGKFVADTKFLEDLTKAQIALIQPALDYFMKKTTATAPTSSPSPTATEEKAILASLHTLLIKIATLNKVKEIVSI